MAQNGQSKAWWRATVKRWRKSGLSAGAFSDREGLKVTTLRWWSWKVGREDGVGRETSPLPIEIAVPHSVSASPKTLEIVVGAVLVRCEVGTDAPYVASLVRALLQG